MFLKSTLLECSLVSVPANSEVLSMAKTLGVRRSTQDLVFRTPRKYTDEYSAYKTQAVREKYL